MKKMFFVVVYDIPNNKRRSRLFKAFKNFGIPVQLSTFECLLSIKDLMEVKKIVKKITTEKEDKVRIYPLCESCHGKILNIGHGKMHKKRDTIII